jgi:hypothetical protein
MLHDHQAVTYAEFSPDGTRVVSGSWNETVCVWPVVSAPLPAPEWLPDLAEALAGQRIDKNDVSEVLPVERLFRLRQKLQANAESGYYDRWARWFLTTSPERLSSDVFDATSAAVSVSRLPNTSPNEIRPGQ